ncbi:hypothetical protein [Streptomyces sp. NPDC058773]|uniref:hypothetical protein n=1 Tax=Streptomyces sp. NPDC058773 TaxID=3346632 RepID=UPI0036C41B25
MEEPTSGPEPEAPAEAAPGEPTEPAEPRAPGQRDGGGAMSTAGGLPSGPVVPVPASEPDDRGRADTAAEPEAPAGPQPIGVGVTPTGEAAVDAGLRRLADADHLPASGHLQVYEDVHRGLRDVLAGLDQQPGPPAPSSKTHDHRS